MPRVSHVSPQIPKMAIRGSYEAALRKGVTTALRPRSKGRWFLDALFCYLSLILKYSDTNWIQKEQSSRSKFRGGARLLCPAWIRHCSSRFQLRTIISIASHDLSVPVAIHSVHAFQQKSTHAARTFNEISKQSMA